MNTLAYEYQRAIDAATLLRETIARVTTNDHELTLDQHALLTNADFNLVDAVTDIFLPRRNALMPEAADQTIIHRGGVR